MIVSFDGLGMVTEEDSEKPFAGSKSSGEASQGTLRRRGGERRP